MSSITFDIPPQKTSFLDPASRGLTRHLSLKRFDIDHINDLSTLAFYLVLHKKRDASNRLKKSNLFQSLIKPLRAWKRVKTPEIWFHENVHGSIPYGNLACLTRNAELNFNNLGKTRNQSQKIAGRNSTAESQISQQIVHQHLPMYRGQGRIN